MQASILVGLALLLAPLATGGCGRAAREVVVYTSEDQVFAEPILRDFEKRTGITVRAVYDTEETKSTGVALRLVAEASASAGRRLLGQRAEFLARMAAYSRWVGAVVRPPAEAKSYSYQGSSAGRAAQSELLRRRSRTGWRANRRSPPDPIVGVALAKHHFPSGEQSAVIAGLPED